MRILITGPGTFTEVSGPSPEVGKKYALEDAADGTGRQNKAFHSLLFAFYDWMHRTGTWTAELETGNPEGPTVYDFSAENFERFRDWYKLHWGAGFSHINYVNDKMEMVRVKNMDEIPGYVLEDFTSGNRMRIKAVLKSWADYTVKQRQKAIDNLILFVGIFNCTDKKVQEIIKGMEEAA